MLQLVKREGTGTKQPAIGDRVFVHYEGRLLDGTLFDHSRSRNDRFSFVLGKGLFNIKPAFKCSLIFNDSNYSLFVHRSSNTGMGHRGGHNESWRIVPARL